LSGLVI